MPVSFVVDPALAGDATRADHIVRAHFPAVDRAYALKLLKEGRLAVGKSKATLSSTVKAGSVLTVDAPEVRLGKRLTIPFTVLHRSASADIVIVDKAVGVAMHDGVGVGDDEEGDDVPLTDAIRSQFVCEGGDFRGPSFLGRLDRPTSGIVVAALSRHGLQSVEPAWRESHIRKEYLVMVRGHTDDTFTIDIPLMGRRPHQRGKGVVEEAKTVGTTLARGEGMSLIIAELFTGRTHQIRRHMKAIRHPVVGDPRYGARDDDGALGLMLHAWRLRRADGVTTWPSQLPERIEAPVPRRFLDVGKLAGIEVKTAVRLSTTSD
jgi:23S rRNA pseudouridine955/2504/2580 synthase